MNCSETARWSIFKGKGIDEDQNQLTVHKTGKFVILGAEINILEVLADLFVEKTFVIQHNYPINLGVLVHRLLKSKQLVHIYAFI